MSSDGANKSPPDNQVTPTQEEIAVLADATRSSVSRKLKTMRRVCLRRYRLNCQGFATYKVVALHYSWVRSIVAALVAAIQTIEKPKITDCERPGEFGQTEV